MNRQQITVSLPDDLAQYVTSAPDASSLIADALQVYRRGELSRELAHAYHYLKALLPILQQILDGSCAPALASAPDLTPMDAVEVRLLIERLTA
jgi:hypothetical protein